MPQLGIDAPALVEQVVAVPRSPWTRSRSALRVVVGGGQSLVETDFGQTDFGHRYPTTLAKPTFAKPTLAKVKVLDV